MAQEPIKKHPDIIAWEQYEKDHPGSLKTATLGNNNPDFYLKNRLQAAFFAGIKIAEDRAIKLKKQHN